MAGPGELDRLVRDAHAEGWQSLGRLFARRGGGVAVARDLRLMASGLPVAWLNGGDVCGSEPDLAAAREFYAAHGVPWGLRVPCELEWVTGRLVRPLRLMGLVPAALRAHAAPGAVTIAAATAADLDAVAQLDASAFGNEPELGRAWMAPLLETAADTVTVALARHARHPVGMGYALRSGATLHLGGIAVAAEHRRRGVGAALTSWLLLRGFAAGACLAELSPDTDAAARLYARLGFVETAGMRVYTDL